jgi:hypothetical protein
MAVQTLRFRIRPDGRVEELVEGLPGRACEDLTTRIESRLGSVQARQSTSEAYQSLNADLTSAQALESFPS